MAGVSKILARMYRYMDIIFSKHFTQRLFYMFFFSRKAYTLLSLYNSRHFCQKKKEIYSDVYFREDLVHLVVSFVVVGVAQIMKTFCNSSSSAGGTWENGEYLANIRTMITVVE